MIDGMRILQAGLVYTEIGSVCLVVTGALTAGLVWLIGLL